MALEPGSKLGPYEVLGALGAGGMGEVYRAKDTRLDRTVAIKVLPPELASDPDRRARFEREAKAISSLNHPHICTLYEFDTHDCIDYLVMEHIEGETLAHRLNKGALPLDRALKHAVEIANALDKAHRQGVVHRDLKPSNIMLTKSGAKLLDFGLAKLQQSTAGAPASSHLPTEAEPLTAEGTVLGTFPYMSPEQLEGKEADARTDIFAFGAVFYEMLTGRRAFQGKSQASLTAAILGHDPPALTELQPMTPALLDMVMRRCLEKDPDARWQSAADVAAGLRWIGEGSAPGAAQSVPSAAQRALPWIAGALAIALALWAPWRTLPTPSPLRLDTNLGPDLAFDSTALSRGPAAILSPDGTHLAFVAREPGDASRIYIRPLARLEARPLPGTEGATSPFFSPDGQWIGFFAEDKLRKVAVTGGAAITLADASSNSGGSWGEDGNLVLTPRSTEGWGLHRVSSSGGEIQTLTTPGADTDEVTHRWPQVLGDGRVLYTAHRATGGYDDASIIMEAFPDGPREVVHRGGYHGRYLPSGHLVFIHQETLFTAPFDLDQMELTGSPVPVIEGVRVNPFFAGAQFSFSDTGTLVYVAGRDLVGHRIHWLDRDGTTKPMRDERANWYNLRFSPDGNRLAMQIRGDTQSDVWIYERSRDTLTRLTLDPADDMNPVWTPDGRHVVFSSWRGGKGVPNLYWRPSDGSGEATRLTESENQQEPTSWHPSGRFLAFHERSPSTGLDVKILEMEWDEASGWVPGALTTFVEDPFIEAHAVFSPDGRFVAYVSDESGRYEVYVRPFPGPGGKWQVSADSGLWPKWSKTRPELLFPTARGEIMVASYRAVGDSFRSERPVPWYDLRLQRLGWSPRFDLHPDGERIALGLAGAEIGAGPDSVIVVTNFFDELRRLTAESGVAKP